MPASDERVPMDLDAYVHRVRGGRCFICEHGIRPYAREGLEALGNRIRAALPL
jgi:hypothetical protein